MGGKPRFSDGELLAAFHEHQTIKAVAQALQYDHSTVSRRAKALGLNPVRAKRINTWNKGKPAYNRRVSDGELVAAYRKHRSVWRAAKAVGLCGQSVHERLSRLGITNPPKRVSDAAKQTIAEDYDAYASLGRGGLLAQELGLDRCTVTTYAHRLGLTNKHRKKPYLSTWKYMPLAEADKWWEMFKLSSLGLTAFCKRHKIDDLGFSRRMRELYRDEWDYVIELKQPRQSKYRLGRSFEYKARDYLRKQGYFVMRSPASKSPIDLVAIAHGCALFVQCKKAGYLDIKGWNELFDIAQSCGAKPILACRPNGKARGVALFEILARKDGSRRSQPMAPLLHRTTGEMAKLMSPNPRLEIEVSELANVATTGD